MVLHVKKCHFVTSNCHQTNGCKLRITHEVVLELRPQLSPKFMLLRELCSSLCLLLLALAVTNTFGGFSQQEMCQCKANRTRCCRQCAFCLAKLWEPCCDCVGLCDERISSTPHPAQRSSMHDLVSPVPSLFRALLCYKSPVLEQSQFLEKLISGLNATAPVCQSIYFNDCLSMSRCRAACQSVGAWRYRWFHSACCQCLGPDCQGYGGAHANCSNCQD
uniref:Uncharacterized protein n=1 Tax=Laticauda laticaudata TaxID=8630 RepID=A0A8C5RYP7_LATLA